MKKKNISKLFVVPAVLGLAAGFFSSIHSSVFSIAQADDVTRVQGSYCSTNTSSNSTAGELYFNMLANDAPSNSDWSLMCHERAMTTSRTLITSVDISHHISHKAHCHYPLPSSERQKYRDRLVY